MAREYSKGTVTVYKGRWRARLRWREDGGAWKERNGYLTEYDDHGAKRQLLPPKETGRDEDGKPLYRMPSSIDTALEQWRDSVIARDRAEEERQRAEEARQKAERIAAEEAARRARDPQEKLRADTAYCVRWYVEKWASEDSVEASTTRGYRTLAKRIEEAVTEDGTPYFKGVPLDQVTASQVQQWEMEQRRSGLSLVTIKKRVNLLRAVYREATDTSDGQEPLTRNFPFPARNRHGKLADRKAAAKTARSRNDVNAYDQAEYDEAVRKLARMGLEEDGWVEAAGLICLLTGMRRQEVAALRWGDCDLENDTIYVRTAIGLKDGDQLVQGVPRSLQTKGSYVKSLKTGEGEGEARTVPMLSSLKSFLLDLWDMQTRRAKEINARHAAQFNEGRDIPGLVPDLITIDGDSFVIGDMRTRKWRNPDALTHRWAGVSKTLPKGNRGRYCTLYDLRHSFCTQLVRDGVDEFVGSAIVGNSPAVFREHYISKSERENRKAIEQMDRAAKERERRRRSKRAIPIKTGTDN